MWTTLTQMVEAKVSITSGFKAGVCWLHQRLRCQRAGHKGYNTSTGVLTLSGPARDISNVLNAFKTVTYVSTSEDPGNATRTVTWQVKDANSDATTNGQLVSNTVTTTVSEM